ncbi:MAG: hypothetical protein WEA58_04025 [Balneolaceae bacterium]
MSEHSVSGASFPLADSDQAFKKYILTGLDKVTQGNKATFLTSALIFADVAKDRNRLRDLSNEHKAALNEYFEEIDIEKLFIGNNDLVKPAKEAFQASLISQVPALLSGAALGVFAVKLIGSKSNKS